MSSQITKESSNPKEKMDAILNYCQKNIRYEQVYFENGEIIPNSCSEILKNKFGDCKDYSLLIYSLAKAAGINAKLALSYRGRGLEFFPTISVDQFNHMLVYLNFNGKDYWYDGTNRTGIPGITTTDLINQKALILDKDNSRLINIDEYPENNLIVKGNLSAQDEDLKGNLEISFQGQYAINLFYAKFNSNKGAFAQVLDKWLKKNLNHSIIVQNLSWSEDKDKFIVNVKCDIPNSILSVDNIRYVSLKKIIPEIIPLKEGILKPSEVFYYPYYDKVKIDLKLENLAGLNDDQKFYNIYYNYHLSPGPFNKNDAKKFVKDYNTVLEQFNKNIKLRISGS